MYVYLTDLILVTETLILFSKALHFFYSWLHPPPPSSPDKITKKHSLSTRWSFKTCLYRIHDLWSHISVLWSTLTNRFDPWCPSPDPWSLSYRPGWKRRKGSSRMHEVRGYKQWLAWFVLVCLKVFQTYIQYQNGASRYIHWWPTLKD